MKARAILPAAALSLAACVIAPAATSANGREERSIADSIEAQSGGRIRIAMDESVARVVRQDTIPAAASERISLAEESQTDPASHEGKIVYRPGYRIQLYAGNNQRTAKAQAQRLAAQMAKAFPEYGLYLAYKSPYWRLKMGDFLTREEALSAMDDIKAKLPSLSQEMRVVRDRIKHFE